jgi:peptide/nickel transport system substrate-binding protein/oligopeptide transport system substrate-binding protein
MLQSVVDKALLIALWVCAYQLLYTPVGVTQSFEQSAPQLPGAQFGGTFRRMLGANPVTLDPALVTDSYGVTVVNQIFNGLVQFDANLKPIPALAEFWEASRDGRTWTFTLRQGVKFHNGREVTAQDVVYSFTRLLDATKPLPVADLFQYIQGAREFRAGKAPSVQGLQAPDRYTFRMALEEPLAPLLTVLGLTNTAVVPQEEVEKPGRDFGHAPVGTGPFKFVRWQPGEEIVLAANDQYYEGRPFLDAVVFKIILGSKLEKTFAEFLKGNLEETIIPSGKLEEVRVNPHYRQYRHFHKPTLSLLYLGFNTQMQPFNDRRVRQAFNYAVNKKVIVREIARMGHVPAVGALPPWLPGYDPNLQGYDYNPAKARELLAAAGYPNGTGLPVVQIWSNQQTDGTKAELEAYQRYLAAIGVRVEIHFAPDWRTFRVQLEQGILPMFRLRWLADIPDPDNVLVPLLHSASATNRTFYHNPRVDQLLEQARKETDEARRITHYHEVERIVMHDVPWITQHYSILEFLYQPYVQGVEVSLLGKPDIPLHKIWLKRRPATSAIGAITYGEPRE